MTITLEWYWWFAPIITFISALTLPDVFPEHYEKDCAMFALLGMTFGIIIGHYV